MVELVVEGARDAPTLGFYKPDEWAGAVAHFLNMAVADSSPKDFWVFITNGEKGEAIKEYASLSLSLASDADNTPEDTDLSTPETKIKRDGQSSPWDVKSRNKL